MSEKGKPQYDTEALRKNITRCEKTIKTFQDAIAKEYETIGKLRQYLKELEGI